MRKISDNAFMPVMALLFFLLLVAVTQMPYSDIEAVFKTAHAEESNLTLIIDPGHGGADGGAVSLSGVPESEINLDISKKIEQITAFFGVNVIATRDSEYIAYPDDANTIRKKKAADQQKRLSLIKSTPNPVLISIHQNTYPSSGPSGAVALYAPTAGSEDFAVYMQEQLVKYLDQTNRRSAYEIPDNILLMNHISCPAVMVECGFLSNVKEESLLMTDGYRLKIAAVISASFLFCDEAIYESCYGGTNEA